MKKETVVLSGGFYGVEIKDKHLLYKGDDFSLVGCSISNCTIGVEGESAKGIQFMKDMFKAGAKCSVMKTFLTDEEYEIVKKALGWQGEDGD